MPNIPGAIKQAVADIGEAVVKPVTDEVGKAIEEGAQSVAGGQQAKQLDPAVQQAKAVEEQKRRAWAVHVIEWNKKIQEEQQKVRQGQKQEEMQKSQQEAETQKVKQLQVVQQQQKQAQLTEAQKAARRTELKGGVGG